MLDSCEPARHLFVAVPAYTGSVSTETAASLGAAVPALNAAGVQTTVKYRNGNCYLDHVRNQLVADFMATDATDLLFVDADVGFLADAALRMCMVRKPVVAGIYPLKADSLRFPVHFEPGTERWSDADGLIECLHAPTGFLRINRTVFEAMPSRVYLDQEDGVDRVLRDHFRCDMRDRYYGEDVEFCRRWREAGGKVRIIPDLTFAHFGMKSWVGNWGEAAKAGLV